MLPAVTPEIQTAVNNFLVYIVPPTLSLMGIAVVYMVNKLRRKIKEKDGKEALAIFDTAVEKVVSALNQTIVSEIKSKQRRRLNANDVNEIKCKAKDNINNILSKSTKKSVKDVIKNYDQYLDHSIESSVNKYKIEDERKK